MSLYIIVINTLHMGNFIYIIKNFANNKIYIGKTERSVEERFREHLQESRHPNSPTYNYCLSRAIRKYGENAFDVAILAEDVPIEKLDLVEAHYIDMYNSNNPEIGYNISSGHSDNSMVNEYRDMQPEENYETNSRVNTDDISNEEIEQFLKEF